MNGATPWPDTVAPANEDRRRRAPTPSDAGCSRSNRSCSASTRPARQQLQPDHDDDGERRPARRPQRRRPGHDEPARGTSPAMPRSWARKRIQPKHDEVERDEPAQPGRRGAAGRRARARRRARRRGSAPQSTNVQRRAVPEAAEEHRDHQVAVGQQAARRGCRPAGCRGSRAGSATASCASGARSRGSPWRGTGCGSSAGRRSPSAARGRSPCRCSPRSRSRSARRRRRRRATTSGAAVGLRHARTPGRRPSRAR